MLKINKNGFTLSTTLAIIVIAGIVAGIAVPAVGKIMKDSKKKEFVEEFNLVGDAAISYCSTHGDADICKKSATLPFEIIKPYLPDELTLENNRNAVIVNLDGNLNFGICYNNDEMRVCGNTTESIDINKIHPVDPNNPDEIGLPNIASEQLLLKGIPYYVCHGDCIVTYGKATPPEISSNQVMKGQQYIDGKDWKIKEGSFVFDKNDDSVDASEVLNGLWYYDYTGKPHQGVADANKSTVNKGLTQNQLAHCTKYYDTKNTNKKVANDGTDYTVNGTLYGNVETKGEGANTYRPNGPSNESFTGSTDPKYFPVGLKYKAKGAESQTKTCSNGGESIKEVYVEGKR